MAQEPNEAQRVDWKTELLVHKSNIESSDRAAKNTAEMLQNRLIEEINVRDAELDNCRKQIIELTTQNKTLNDQIAVLNANQARVDAPPETVTPAPEHVAQTPEPSPK